MSESVTIAFPMEPIVIPVRDDSCATCGCLATTAKPGFCRLYRQGLKTQGDTYAKCGQCVSMIRDMRVQGIKGLQAMQRLQRQFRRMMPAPQEFVLRREDFAENG